jgi:putative two-component system response regulator
VSFPAFHPAAANYGIPSFNETRLCTLHRLARAADRDTADEHTARVACTAALLGERLGLAPAEVALLRQAAPLHDIGKLAVSDEILLKPGILTAEEVRQMRRHVLSGAAMLSGGDSDVTELAREIALTHHEWWDGSGYPNGLAGDVIPISGRIVALADVFDALTHERPYKRAWLVGDAVAEIRRLRGSQFDPAVVDAFETINPTQLV